MVVFGMGSAKDGATSFAVVSINKKNNNNRICET